MRYRIIKVLNDCCIMFQSFNSVFSSLLINIWFVLQLKASASVNIFVQISINSLFLGLFSWNKLPVVELSSHWVFSFFFFWVFSFDRFSKMVVTISSSLGHLCAIPYNLANWIFPAFLLTFANQIDNKKISF